MASAFQGRQSAFNAPNQIDDLTKRFGRFRREPGLIADRLDGPVPRALAGCSAYPIPCDLNQGGKPRIGSRQDDEL
jgi:hypothetical protein